jgi:ribosomal protein S6--L-glutamate ligase
MKIAILARNPKLYSHRRLVEAAEARGHQIEVINTLHCYMNITSRRPEVRYQGRLLDDVDAVIPRIGASVTFYGLAVLRQFEMMGVYPLNESVAIGRSRDKLRALQILAREGIGLPVTGFAHEPDDTDDLIRIAGGAPLIVKLITGTHGEGVVLAETDQTAASVIDAFRNLEAHFLVQEFVRESSGEDLRCIVIGQEVVAAMRRTSKRGDFRANLHKGGKAAAAKITDEERATAVRAAETLGLNVAGVDMLRSNRGPLVLEVNSSPGLEGIERVSGVDIASRIVAFIESNARRHATQTKGQG